MLTVLIVDDTQEKISEIRNVLKGFVSHPEDVQICGCVRSALKECAKKRYDLVILDLFIPKIEGEVPDPENAKLFLKLVQILINKVY